MNKNSLGCGRKFKIINGKCIETNNPDFICGVANAWGKEILCHYCNFLLKEKWKKEEILKK